jgi:hypothetical protein
MLERLASSAPGVQLARVGPIIVSVFNTMPNKLSLEALNAAQEVMIQTEPRLLSLVIIPAMGAVPSGVLPAQANDSERRTVVSQSAGMAERFEEHLVASAVVILSTGVVAVLARSFLAAMSLVSRSRRPMKTFKSVKEATAWLTTVADAPAVPPGFLADIEGWLGELQGPAKVSSTRG